MNFDDKKNNWWRWLAFIPAGLLLLVVGSLLGKLLVYLYSLLDVFMYGGLGIIGVITHYCLTAIVEGFCSYYSVIIAGYISPKPNIGVPVFGALILLLFGASIISKILLGYDGDWFYYVAMLANIAGVIVAFVRAPKDIDNFNK